MPETRTTSSTGGQKGTKLARFDLIPQGPITEVAEHFGVGARKYANHQWRQGYEWSKSFAAKQRHDAEFWAGKDYDVCSNDPDGCSHVDADGNEFVPVRPDTCFNHTGSHHMAASAWHALVLLEFKDRFPGFDDRYNPAEDDAKYDDAMAARLDQFVAHDQAEPGEPLGPEWQELGYIDETGDPFRPLDEVDLQPYRDVANDYARQIAALLGATRSTVEIDWQDPALPTLAEQQELLNRILRNEWLAEHYIVPRVFIAGIVGDETIVEHKTIAQQLVERLDGDFLSKRHPYAVPFKVPQPFIENFDELNDALTDVGDDH